MSRALSFRAENAIRRAGAIDIVCGESDGGKIWHITAEHVRNLGADYDFAGFVRKLVDDGVVLPDFIMPSKFLPTIIMKASPNIRQILGRAAAMGE